MNKNTIFSSFILFFVVFHAKLVANKTHYLDFEIFTNKKKPLFHDFMKKHHLILLFSFFAGAATGYLDLPLLSKAADTISQMFMNYLSMLAAPIVLLSILSTLTSVRELDQIKILGKKVSTYTLLTTLLASLVALSCFLFLNPAAVPLENHTDLTHGNAQQYSYLHFLIEIIPTNLFKALAEGKVISIAFLAFLFGIASHFLPQEQRQPLEKGFSALFQLFLKIVGWATRAMPLAIWAFVALLVKELKEGTAPIDGLWRYLLVVLLANLLQGFIVIPLLLKARGIAPSRIAKAGLRALLTAFFTKSSNAALPMSLKAAKEELELDPKVANFSLPLCTVINMNGCAAFILTTVLFVAGIHGHVFSPFDLAFWVILSVFAAIGNAGVPMGCFFLSSACLISLNVPLTTMGLILPFYAVIDMVETALNVWSDLSVTALVDRDCKETTARKPIIE